MKKDILLLLSFILLSYSCSFGQEEKVSPEVGVIVPRNEIEMQALKLFYAPNGKSNAEDTMGIQFFKDYFNPNDIGVAYMGRNEGMYGYINKIIQKYYFMELEYYDEYKIKEVLIKYIKKKKNNVKSQPSVQKVYLNLIKKDSSYRTNFFDSTSFTFDDIDTTKATYYFEHLTSVKFPNLENKTVKLTQDIIGLAVIIEDDSVKGLKANKDTAWHVLSIFPEATYNGAFWKCDLLTQYILRYDYHQMFDIFLVADDVSGIVGSEKFIDGIQLSANYPNPAPGGKTSVSYSLSKEMNVRFQIMDVGGRIVEIFNGGTKQAGTYIITLDQKLPKGVYYYSLIGNGNVLTKKMIIE